MNSTYRKREDYCERNKSEIKLRNLFPKSNHKVLNSEAATGSVL